MPRSPHKTSDIFPYHVSARCLNREWFGIEPEILWEIFSEQLFFIYHAFGVRIHSFVLMGNHFHLICSTPHANLSEGMQYFMTQTSKIVGAQSGRINQVYGRRYFRSLITSSQYFEHAYKYVYRNPVQANMCQAVEEYKWSTLHSLLGKSVTIIPIEEDPILMNDPNGTLEWLNSAFIADHYEVIKAALRKHEFKLPKTKIHGTKIIAHELEILRC